jgi:hypothetical protein
VSTNSNKSKVEKPKIQCQGKCHKIKVRNSANFFKSNNPKHNTDLYGGYAPICKHCLRESVMQEDGVSVNVNGLLEVLKFLDRPFIQEEYLKIINDQYFDLGKYLSKISLNKYKSMIFKDSDVDDKIKDKASDLDEGFLKINKDNQDINKFREKFGYGYKDKEYILFEKKYQNLKSSINLKSTIHEEYFKSFCVNSVLANLAKSEGDLRKAKDLNDMAQQDAKASNMQPKDIDLTNGVDSISEIVEKVEQASTVAELMGILPAFKEHPKDKVDTVFYYITNYQRKLKGLPECKYADLYQFYDKRAKEIEKDMIDNSIIDSDINE